MGVLIITHYQRILHMVKPQFVHIMFEGRIVKEGGPELVASSRSKGTPDPRRGRRGGSMSLAVPTRPSSPYSPGGPRLPRQRRHVADSAAGAGGDGALLRDVPREHPPRRLSAGGGGHRGLRGRARPGRRVHRVDARRDGLHPQRDRGDQPRRGRLGPRERRQGRPRGGDPDGAPLNIVPWQLLGCRLAYIPVTEDGLLDLDAFDALLEQRPEAGRGRARLERPRHDQPDRRDRAPRARRRRRGAGRRRAGRSAPAGGRGRTRRRLLRLDRPQGLRADRHRRAARPPPAAGDDAAVPRRRAHDRPRRRLRVDGPSRRPSSRRARCRWPRRSASARPSTGWTASGWMPCASTAATSRRTRWSGWPRSTG